MSLFGKGRGDGAPRAWAKALEALLAEIPERRSLVDFVLTGRHSETLPSVARTPWLSQAHDRGDLVDRAALTALYGGFADVDADVLRRWGRVLDEAFGPHSWGLTLGTVAGGHWLELMVNQAASVSGGGALPITFADAERIAAVDGAGPDDVLRAVFELPPYTRYAGRATRHDLGRMPGFPEALLARQALVGAALTSGTVEERIAALTVVQVLDDAQLATFADSLAEAATAGSQQVRDAAAPLVGRLAGASVAPLRTLATEAKPDQRARALELLVAVPDQHDWAVATATNDRAASVRAVAARSDAAQPCEAVDDLPLPEPRPLPSWAVPPDIAERVAEEVIEALAESVHAHNRSAQQQRLKFPRPGCSGNGRRRRRATYADWRAGWPTTLRLSGST